MRHMKKMWVVGTVCGGLGLMSSAVSANVTVDDFESYSDGQEIGTGFATAPDHPWAKFGGASDPDHFRGVSEGALAGTLSGRLILNWNGAPFEFTAVRRDLDSTTDITSFLSVDAQIDSNVDASTTMVKLSLFGARADGPVNGILESTTPFTLGDDAMAYSFSLDPAGLTLLDENGDPVLDPDVDSQKAHLLQNVEQIGFMVINSNHDGDETVLVDNVRLVVPEPTSLAGLALGGAAVLLRRKR